MATINNLSSQVPFLLFPVQVQVKFVQNPASFVAEHPSRSPHELRIRIYPDQIGLNTHEDKLTTEETEAGQHYWLSAPAAATHSLHAIGPWRVLVNRYGTNRARYILQQTQPTNLAAMQQGLSAGTAVVPAFNPLATGTGRWTQPATSLVMPAYFTAILYRPVEEAGKIQDAYINKQLLPNLKQPYSPDLLKDFTSEFLEIAKQVDGEPIADGPLQVGPDPTANTTGFEDGGPLAWMGDFELALTKGMAIAVPLTPTEFKTGFARLVVLGLGQNDSVAANATATQQVFVNHLHTDGLELIPQGTPTNNTENAGAGYSSAEQYDADTSFQELLKGSLFVPKAPNAPVEQSDGQHFTAALGLPVPEFDQMRHTDGTDGREARLMNRALWPATYGYFLENMMRPVFSPEAIEWTRTFFQDYVLGRGNVPAFRVRNEPYGVLPTTRFSAWQSASSLGGFGSQLLEVLRRLDVTWTERLNQVGAYPQVVAGVQPTDEVIPSQQNLLTTLGSDATSVEFYQRYMLGPNMVDTLHHHAQTQQRSIWPSVFVSDADPEQPGTLTRRAAGRFGTDEAPLNPLYSEFRQFFGDGMGLEENKWPAIFDQTFQSTYQKIAHTYADLPVGPRSGMGGLIDDLPLSEKQPPSPFPATEVNYIEWLATSSFDDIRLENFAHAYEGERPPRNLTPPTSLLYHLLRHAVLLQYWQAAADTVGLSSAERSEKELFNVVSQDDARWQLLYTPAPGSSEQLQATLRAGKGAQGAKLVAYLAEVRTLATVPTARLERVLAEHLDLGNHRIDAWKTALVAHRLTELRSQQHLGNYLGAFSWLEDVCPEDRSTSATGSAPGEVGAGGGVILAPIVGTEQPVSVSPLGITSLDEAHGDARLDPDNLGYIHAPSLNHAMTAAILRQGYKSRQHTVAADDVTADRMSVNLSSERVRKALAILQGIRGGQSLSALLGQEFEKALAEYPVVSPPPIPYGYFVRYFRETFPYAGEKKLVGQTALGGTPNSDNTTRQVVDGLALIRAGAGTYPYGVDGIPGTGSGAKAVAADPDFTAAVATEIAALVDTLDALGDLTVGESIYQSVMGNTEQASAMLDSIAKGKFPVNPQIVEAHPAGIALTHRVLVHLPQSAPAALANWERPVVAPATPPATPLADAIPALNNWLAGFFGNPATIRLAYLSGAQLAVEMPGESAVGTGPSVALNQTGIQPIDLLYLLENNVLRRGSTLDTLLRHAIAPDAAGADDLLIDYTCPGANTLRRFIPLAHRLRQLVAGSRAALPKDLQTTASAAAASDALGVDEEELVSRFNDLLLQVQTLLNALPAATAVYDTTGMSGLARNTQPLPTLPTPHQLRPLLRQAASFGIAEAIQALTAPAATVLHSAVLVRQELARRFDLAQKALGQKLTLAAPAPTGKGNPVFIRPAPGDPTAGDPNEVGAYATAGEALFGASFRLVLAFTLPTAAAAAYTQATNTSTRLLRNHVQNPLVMQEWLQGIAQVRDPLDHLSKVSLINDLLWDADPAHALPELQPTQLAAVADADAYWLGVPYPATYTPPGDALSLVQLLPDGYAAVGPQCALWLDEWNEVLPADHQTTAVAFHYDQPNTSAPQSLLLVVSPDSEDNPEWSYGHLLGAINETLDLAKKRTVEPDALALTHLSSLLPALVSPVSQHGVTFTLDYRSVNHTAKFKALPLRPQL